MQVVFYTSIILVAIFGIVTYLVYRKENQAKAVIFPKKH